MISDDEVKKIAKLAHLSINESEVQGFAKDLNSILDYVNSLQKVNVDGVTAMSHVHGATNVFREDIVEPSMPAEKALSNAPDTSGRFIRVPIIIEQGGEN